jgi:hypothetical protein
MLEEEWVSISHQVLTCKKEEHDGEEVGQQSPPGPHL